MPMLVQINWKVIILLSVIIIRVRAWDNDDLEVFDVVEDVDQNFYELLGVAQVCTYCDTFINTLEVLWHIHSYIILIFYLQEASSSEIRAAYRVLTLKLHPDKNDAPDADVQFRNLVSVYNILKDPGKREK